VCKTTNAKPNEECHSNKEKKPHSVCFVYNPNPNKKKSALLPIFFCLSVVCSFFEVVVFQWHVWGKCRWGCI